MRQSQDVFADLLARIEARLAAVDGVSDPSALADEQLREAEGVIESWLVARGEVPADGKVEGFRLIALHRQGTRGNPGFNACRETCREVVYLRNVVRQAEPSEARRHLRLQAMVLRHLALFVGGRMMEAGLGEFCCSSRPLRMVPQEAPQPAIRTTRT